MSFGAQTPGSACIEQQYFTWSSAAESTVKRYHRRPSAGAETGEISICPEIRTYLSRPGSGPPDLFKPIWFRCVLYAGVSFKLFSDFPRRFCRQWVTIHHMRIGKQPQQARFGNPAEYEQVPALGLKPAFGHEMMRVRVHRKSDPDVDIRQVDHQSQDPSGLASFPWACGSKAASGAWPPSEVSR